MSRVLAGFCFLLLLPAVASAQRSSDLAERVSLLEQRLENAGDRETLIDLLLRIDQLEAEVRTLRGMIEEARFEAETLGERQRDQYLDLDRRLQAVETSGPRPATVDDEEVLVASVPEVEEPPVASQPEDIVIPLDPATEPVDQPQVDSGAAQAAYDEAFAALRDGRYPEAERAFSRFLSDYPSSELADNAQYWLGESHYVEGNYRVALENFETLLAQFPDSRKAPDALLKVGFSHYELGQLEEARAALESVVDRHPDTTVARLAQSRLRAIQLEGSLR